jgi:hypothetical protein
MTTSRRVRTARKNVKAAAVVARRKKTVAKAGRVKRAKKK